jgi:glyoxylase-like metal-dependent hydrolase (beta-lactamase superfamily II)
MKRAIGRLVLCAGLVVATAGSAAAQVNFSGEWTGRYHEDQPDRVPGEEPGDFSGIPVNDAARRFGDSYDVGRHSVLEEQCAPYTLPYMFFGPNQFRIWQQINQDTQELVAIEMHLGTYQQRRTIWLDGRPHPPAYAPHTFMGFSTGEWHGDVLTVTTTHIKQGYFRRSGVPASDRTTVVEHWMRHGNTLSQVTIATDPVYLTEPYIRSQDFVLMERGNTNWLYNCEYAMELPRDKNLVPHYLPGKNPWQGEFERKHFMPAEGVRGGAESLLPDWKPGAPAARPNPAKNGGFPATVLPQALPAGEVRAVKVQGNVYVIVGAGANIAAHVGEDGILVVDTGAAGQGEKVVAAVKALAPDKEIRWVINTSPNADHIANNEVVSKAGRTVNGNQAAVVAHENANERMIARNVPDAGRPYNTYFEAARDFPFNGEPVILSHDASTVDDASTVVFFRRSDVLVTGDVFRTDSFPVIDLDAGGSTQGVIDALNRLLDLAVPSKSLQEGGTYIVPGHGRISDEHDLVWYRDMLVIIRDRIQDMVGRKMTLAQVQAAKPALDYEGRYGAETGAWTTAMFVEAIYKDLSRVPAAGGK